MYLKSLELSGFKSFARKANLSFTSPITAIVGPNGSGKSNVAEAFRFVLGEQSMKSMRGKRTEDLIWNGSRTAAKSNRANVKLVFDNTLKQTEAGPDRLFDIDFDEVVIERVIHRDASSEYHLNGSPVRLKDIIELLSRAHIGASGHHIISQGEADRVLSVNSKERRAMIEDALGLKIYQYKKEESLRKLEKTEENLEKAESIRREIKPHLAFLAKQVAKIEKAQELAGELVTRYREYFAREDAYLSRQKERLQGEKAPLAHRSHEIEKELAKARGALERIDAKDASTTDLLAIEEKLRVARNDKDACTEELGRVEGEFLATERLVERERAKREEGLHASIPFASVHEFASELSQRIDAAENEQNVAALMETIRDIKTRIATFIERFKSGTGATGDLEELAETLAVLGKKKQALSETRERLEKDERALADEYRTVQKKIETDRDSGREMERAIFALTNEGQEIRLKLQVITGREETLRLETEEFERELKEAGAIAGLEAVRYRDLISLYTSAMETEERAEQETRKRAIEKMKVRLEDSGMGGADEVLKEHKEVSERDAFLEHEMEDLKQTAESLQTLIRELDEKLASEFEEGIKKINKEFETFFSLMFGGGEASLELVKERPRKREEFGLDDEDGMPSEAVEEERETSPGVEIHVSLPRKKIRGLEMLSGGERALTSIALIFAMSQVNPPPFIILDETDAALDEANSKRYGDMIENLARKTQLILITHNRETMSRAGVLYGVTMGSDAVSQLLSVSLDEAAQVAK